MNLNEAAENAYKSQARRNRHRTGGQLKNADKRPARGHAGRQAINKISQKREVRKWGNTRREQF